MQNTYMCHNSLKVMNITTDVSFLFYKNRPFEELKVHICSYKAQLTGNKTL